MGRKFLVLSALLLLVTACDRGSIPIAPLSEHRRTRTVRDTLCHHGVEAFSKTVHPHVRGDCLPCHDIGGMSGKPHSVEDVEKSYRYMLGYVNWSALDDSFLIKKGGNSHCKNYPQGKCVSTQEDMRRIIRAWWDAGQKDCPNMGTFVTRPEKIPKGGGKMLFDLGHLVGGLNARLTVEIYQEPNAYAIMRPRLKTDKPVNIVSFQPLLNGKLQSASNGWTKIAAAISAHDPEGVLLSAEIVRIPMELEQDELSISIGKLEMRVDFSCSYPDKVRTHVLPVLSDRSCYRCHGGGPNNELGEIVAKTALDMTASEEALCLRLLERGSGRNKTDSPLISLPLRGLLGHPRVIPLSSEILPMWVEWIRAEGVHPQ